MAEKLGLESTMEKGIGHVKRYVAVKRRNIFGVTCRTGSRPIKPDMEGKQQEREKQQPSRKRRITGWIPAAPSK